jgi:hypothetical protein
MIRLALIAALALGGCNAVYDPGGDLAQREKQIQAEAKSNAKVKLPYQCDSSCTEQLFDKDVCIRKGGSIGVHAAHYEATGEIDPYGTNLMFQRYYRYPKFQARVQADHAMDSLAYTYYSATTMHSFGVPYC